MAAGARRALGFLGRDLGSVLLFVFFFFKVLFLFLNVFSVVFRLLKNETMNSVDMPVSYGLNRDQFCRYCTNTVCTLGT